MSKKKAEISITIHGFAPFKEAKTAFESEYTSLVLHEAGGNVSRAAEIAGKDRKDFYDLMRRCDINPAEFR